MKLLQLVLAVCVLGFSAGQTYNQGVVQGATLALAGTAVVGLGVLAIQVRTSRGEEREGGDLEALGNAQGSCSE